MKNKISNLFSNINANTKTKINPKIKWCKIKQLIFFTNIPHHTNAKKLKAECAFLRILKIKKPKGECENRKVGKSGERGTCCKLYAIPFHKRVLFLFLFNFYLLRLILLIVRLCWFNNNKTRRVYQPLRRGGSASLCLLYGTM